MKAGNSNTLFCITMDTSDNSNNKRKHISYPTKEFYPNEIYKVGNCLGKVEIFIFLFLP